MASTINASTSPAAIVQTADGTANLNLQSNGTTIAALTSTGMAVTGTLSASGVTTFAAGTAALPAITTTGDTDTGIWFPAANTVAASTSGTEAMRIDSSGNVGIGTASPSAPVDVVSNSSAIGTRIRGRSSDSYGVLEFTNNGASAETARLAADTSGNIIFSNTGSVTERMRIDSSGGLILAGSTAQKATGTTWSNPSDQRLKDNIRDYTKGTNELMEVRVREWEYNGKGGTTEGTKGLGVVADEVMTVLPNTVETYNAKLNTDDEENTAIKKFDATEITWLLVKTVQEQQSLITSLTARITALEGA